MEKTSQVPFYVRLGNALTLTLLRAGFKLRGPYIFFGNYPMYLLTVRGRKSGLPRTVSIAMIERNGKRYVGSVYGIVDGSTQNRGLQNKGETPTVKGNENLFTHRRRTPACRYKYRSQSSWRQAPVSRKWNSRFKQQGGRRCEPP